VNLREIGKILLNQSKLQDSFNMLLNSFFNIVNNGFYFNKAIHSYTSITFNFILNSLNFFKSRSTRFLLFRSEVQFFNNKPNFQIEDNLDCGSSFVKKKVINAEILKTLPPFRNPNHLVNLNILKKYLIKSYKGKCHALGKPVRGQRTWSNAMNSKNNNFFIRKCISQTSNKIDIDSWS